MPRLARRITDGAPKDFGMYARALGTPGDLIHLELGRPSHDTPAHVKEAAIAALRAGEVHYSDLRGIAPLRAALAAKMRRQEVPMDADQVLVTNGLTQATFAAFMALLDPGDEAVLIAPYYPQHLGKIDMAGARAAIAELDAGDGFALRREPIEAAITPRTRVIALVNPCNPTGRVYSREELHLVADLAIRHDLVVVSDEVYEEIVFEGLHVPIASLPGMAERTVTTGAFTKSFAMDGWRLGWAAAPPPIVEAMGKVAANAVTHVNTFIQHGAVAALEGPPEVLAGLVADDRARRDLVVARLNQMPGVRCPMPQGTIYAFPDIRGTGLSSRAAAEAILREAGVVIESGAFYGAAGEGHLRVCFGCEGEARLGEAMDRLTRFFNAL